MPPARERWYRAARRILIGDDGRPLYFAVLQDSTAEHAARERADRSVRELDDWFDLSPVGMVLFDDSGLLVRTNPAFEALVGSVPVSLAEGDAGPARACSPGGEGGALQSLQTGRAADRVARLGARPAARRCAGCARSCAATRAPAASAATWRSSRTAASRRSATWRSMQIGAMMDTAGVGIATFEESSGWVRQRSRVGRPARRRRCCRAISRDIVAPESLPEYERLQQALQPHRARRGALSRQPSGARPALAAHAGRAGDAGLGQEARRRW